MANDLYRIETTHRVESPQLGGEAVLMTNGGMAFVTLHTAQDAVEVVRCKDCKQWSYWPKHGAHICLYTMTGRVTKADDFCSYGERKDNEEH